MILNIHNLPTVSLENLSSTPLPEFDVAKLDVSFDLNSLLTAAGAAESLNNFRSKDGNNNYTAIALQYSFERFANTDAIDTCTTYINGRPEVHRVSFNFYTRINDAGRCFDFVFQAFEKYAGLSRGRILRLGAKTEIKKHNDGQGALRLHIPLRSNTECIAVFNNKSYYLKPDGSAYLFNASKDHAYVNSSTQNRDHLCFNLTLDMSLFTARKKMDHQTSDAQKEKLADIFNSLLKRESGRCFRCKQKPIQSIEMLERSENWMSLIKEENFALLCAPCQSLFFKKVGYESYSREKSLIFLGGL